MNPPPVSSGAKKGIEMAKKHLQGEGDKSLCGIVPNNGFHPIGKVTCGACRHKSGAKPIENDGEPDWSRKCAACGQSPVVGATGMCGPCTFGESDTAFGNW